MLFAHCHAGSVLPMHPESRAVSAGRDQWQTRVLGHAVLERGLYSCQERMEGGVPLSAHSVWDGDSQDKLWFHRDQTDWSKGL